MIWKNWRKCKMRKTAYTNFFLLKSLDTAHIRSLSQNMNFYILYSKPVSDKPRVFLQPVMQIAQNHFRFIEWCMLRNLFHKEWIKWFLFCILDDSTHWILSNEIMSSPQLHDKTIGKSFDQWTWGAGLIHNE